MINTLFGDVEDGRDLAKKVVMKGLTLPFYEIVKKETDKGISLTIKHDDEYIEHLGKVDFRDAGVYCIYDESQTECLYVGFTTHSIYQRCHRFFKHLAGKSRHDEFHTGAERALENGVEFDDTFYIKFLSWYEFPDRPKGAIWDEYEVDLYVAHLLKSSYNTRTMWW